jgi:hypothetical protein
MLELFRIIKNPHCEQKVTRILQTKWELIFRLSIKIISLTLTLGFRYYCLETNNVS